MTAKIYTVIGMISGTSMDGIDAAVIETDGERVLRRGAWSTTPYPQELRRAVGEAVNDPARAEHEPLQAEEQALTELHASCVSSLLKQQRIAASAVDLIGMHGQTILHRPERRFTRQLGDGALLAKLTGINVVDRFRHADVAAGGEGAPFAPLYHRALSAGLDKPVAVLNLGGVGNVTLIDDGFILAFDTGPASAMIDDWVLRHTGKAYDDGGKIAASGVVDEARLAELMDNPFFAVKPPKSLDRNDFPATPVKSLGLADGAATLTAFTVQSVAASRRHLPRAPRRWLVTGGGRHNATMMRGLAAALGVPVEPVEAVGWQGDCLEAQCFAFLAVRSVLGLPLSEPTTTGVPHPMTGGRLSKAT